MFFDQLAVDSCMLTLKSDCGCELHDTSGKTWNSSLRIFESQCYYNIGLEGNFLTAAELLEWNTA
jgi:hypothetical protein